MIVTNNEQHQQIPTMSTPNRTDVHRRCAQLCAQRGECRAVCCGRSDRRNHRSVRCGLLRTHAARRWAVHTLAVDWLIDWLSHWLICWLIDWTIHWFIDWFVDWLILWLVFLYMWINLHIKISLSFFLSFRFSSHFLFCWLDVFMPSVLFLLMKVIFQFETLQILR